MKTIQQANRGALHNSIGRPQRGSFVIEEGLRDKLDMILAKNTSEIREKLKSASIKQKDLAQDMWSKVFEVIK